MGRPRKPDAQKELEGTARADRKLNGTARPGGEPTPPPRGGLSPTARKVWKDLAPKLTALGLLTEVDGATFAIFCQAHADWTDLTKRLNELGSANWFYDGKNGRQPLPELAVRDKAFQVVQRLGARFGLDPSSRSGISVGTEAKPPPPDEDFLFADQPKVVA